MLVINPTFQQCSPATSITCLSPAPSPRTKFTVSNTCPSLSTKFTVPNTSPSLRTKFTVSNTCRSPLTKFTVSNMSRSLRTKFTIFNTSLSLRFKFTISNTSPSLGIKFTISCCFLAERNMIRLGLPSKGRMAKDTLDLLRDCQLSVRQMNPRQYVAEILQLPNVEVWFQRPKDLVRKLLSGDLDLAIVGLDTVSEYGQGNEDLIIVHDSLEYGECRVSLAIPKYGIFENINSLKELAQMPQWTAEKPFRVVTGFTNLALKFLNEHGLEHVIFTADGALESAPAMGTADAIIDLVSSGITLKENNLKEIKGGVIVESQAVLVASIKSLTHQKGVLEITQEILERLEAHLRASGQFTVTANMRGSSAEEVAERVLGQPLLSGLQGPTLSPVYCKHDGRVSADYYAIVICVPKKMLYKSVQQLRAVGGSGVLVSPLTYIFDEEPSRWRKLLLKLGL